MSTARDRDTNVSNIRQHTWNQPAPLLSMRRDRSTSPSARRIGLAQERAIGEVEGFVGRSTSTSAFEAAVKGTIASASTNVNARNLITQNPHLLTNPTKQYEEQVHTLEFENERLLEEVAELRLVNNDLRARGELVESELIKSNERARLDLEVSQLETDVFRLTRELQNRNDDKAELQQQVETLTAKLESNTFINTYVTNTREGGSDNSELELQLADLEENVNVLLGGLEGKMSELAAANQQVEELQRDNHVLRTENAELINTARTLQSGLQQVNFSSSTTEGGGYDQAKVDEIQDQIRNVIGPLNELLDDQQESYDQLLEEKRRLERENKEKEARFGDLERQIDERTKELRILEGDKRLIQNFNEKLLRQKSYSKIKVPDVQSLDAAVKTIQQLTTERDILAMHLQNFTYSAEAMDGGVRAVTVAPPLVSSVLRQNNHATPGVTNYYRSPSNGHTSTNKVRFQDPEPVKETTTTTLAPPPWHYTQTSVERK